MQGEKNEITSPWKSIFYLSKKELLMLAIESTILTAATHANRTFTLVAANDVQLDSSVARYSPADCQRPEVLNKNLVQGNILLCGYSFNFVVGTASIKKVAETAKSLGAVGFVLAVEDASPGTKFDPVPACLPGIVITDAAKSLVTNL